MNIEEARPGVRLKNQTVVRPGIKFTGKNARIISKDRAQYHLDLNLVWDSWDGWKGGRSLASDRRLYGEVRLNGKVRFVVRDRRWGVWRLVGRGIPYSAKRKSAR